MNDFIFPSVVSFVHSALVEGMREARERGHHRVPAR